MARLPELLDVAEEYGCFSVVDDAHGLGVLGRARTRHGGSLWTQRQSGRDLRQLIEIAGEHWGFVTGSKEIINYLRTNSKQTIFSAAISPGQAACAMASLDLMQTEPEHLARLWKNTKRYRDIAA